MALNLALGWLMICLGMISGAVMGLHFARADWLGGYDSWPRRLLRLGHIAMLALGILNILFSLTVDRIILETWQRAPAAWGFALGGVTMPLVCGLSAWRPNFRRLFFIPVGCLLTGVVTMAIGAVRACASG